MILFKCLKRNKQGAETMEHTDNDLAARLAKLLDQSNLSQTVVAHKIGIDRTAFSKIINGKRKVSTEELKKLADIFEVSTDYLLGNALDMHGVKPRLTTDRSDLNASNLIPVQESDFVNIPVIGTIKAGPNGLAFQDFQGRESVSKRDIDTSHDYFWLVISGESMIGDGINDGDFALIKRTTEFSNGDICAIIVDGEEGTLKHITKSKDSIVLTASNPTYQPRVFIGSDMNQITIVGRLIETKRKY